MTGCDDSRTSGAGWATCVGPAAAKIATATSAPGRDPWATSEMSWNVSGHDPSAWTATLSGYVTKSNDPGGAASSVVVTGTAAWNPAWDGTTHDLGCGFDAEPCHQMTTSNLRNAFGTTSSRGQNRETNHHVDLSTSNGLVTFVWITRCFHDHRRLWRTTQPPCFPTTKLLRRRQTPKNRRLWPGPSWRHCRLRRTRHRQNL